MKNSKQKVQPISVRKGIAKPIVSSSAELRKLRKELKLAMSKLEDAEYELEYAEHMVSQAEWKIELIQKQIKELKDGSIAV